MIRLRGTNQVKAILWKGRPVGIVIVNHGPAAIAGPGPGHGKNRAELLQRNFTCTVEHPASIRHGWSRRHLPSMSRPAGGHCRCHSPDGGELLLQLDRRWGTAGPGPSALAAGHRSDPIIHLMT